MQKVLSIDGGGIRGIIPAIVLTEIERRTGEQRIAEMFDLVAGTSTGGILALGLTKPGQDGKPEYSAKKLIELYETEGEKIFSIPVWHRLHSGWGLAEEKYPSEGIEEVAKRYFKDVYLAEALTEVLVTAYEIERRGPWFFKRRHARDENREGDNFLMRDVARATSAAPTYFEPIQLEWGSHGERAFIDGGVHSNNPAMCAYVEARKIYPEENDFLMVSLGTGEQTRNMPYEEVRGWGLALWAQPILNVVFDGVSDTVDYQLRELLSTEEGDSRRYYRFQTVLDIGKDDMDDASATNLQALKTKAKEIISKNDAALEDLCSQLVA
jgi:patatin-like phospholipase/acyl hydrolase